MNFEDNNPFAPDMSWLAAHASNANIVESKPKVDEQHKQSETKDQIPESFIREHSISDDQIHSRISLLFENSRTPQIWIAEFSNGENYNDKHVYYTIHINQYTVRRRYSEFDSLHKLLLKLYPTVVIPPIPEKHSLSEYLSIGSAKQKANALLIEHRKRMLQKFLDRCASHNILRNDSVFHLFLDSNVSWSEIVNNHIADTSASSSTASLTTKDTIHNDAETSEPSSSSTPRLSIENPETEKTFQETETKIIETEKLLSQTEASIRKYIKLSTNLAYELNEVGGAYNAISLTQEGPLAAAFEKIGQVSDYSYVTTTELVHKLALELEEPIWELEQMMSSSRNLLRNRRSKLLQLINVREQLSRKSALLESLKASEQEANRIEESIKNFKPLNVTANNHTAANEESDTAQLPEYLSSLRLKKDLNEQTEKNGIFNQLNQKFQSIINSSQNTEAGRRNAIGRTYEKITQLEQSIKRTELELQDATEKIDNEIKEVSANTSKEISQIWIQSAQCFKEWAEKNLSGWKDALDEVVKS